jgi:hypothetical protein
MTSRSFAAIHVKVMLQRIADLSDLSQQTLIETTAGSTPKAL